MQRVDSIRRDNTTFVLLSFEGPDQYSCVGKLGERVTHLAETLAQMGFETHLLFVGDPNAPGHEIIGGDKLHLHRWCQWISRYHPESAYQAEEAKLWDLNQSAPPFVVNDIIKKSAFGGKLVVVQGEEWHSAEAISRIADLSLAEGLGESVLTLWNANDVHSFSRIDWVRLTSKSFITTVSKYMKHLMWKMGINPLVIPNGIPRRLLLNADESRADLIRKAYESSTLLVKFADWQPGRRWRSAVEAIAGLKSRGKRSTLIAGGRYVDDNSQRHEAVVVRHAKELGLAVVDVELRDSGIDEQIAALAAAAAADVVHIKSPASDELVRLLYSVGDYVLADSDHEPFGLQALEAMAAGAIVFTGCTGEDYADPLVNAIVLETDGPDEIVEYALYLDERQEERERIRLSARQTAQRHTWDEVAANLIGKIEYLLRTKSTDRPSYIQMPPVNWAAPLPLSPARVRSLFQSRNPYQPNARAS